MIEVKTRKSVFLREAARELHLQATVETSRHESLLSKPSFHESFDALSVRAVRVEPRVFAALQSFVRPGGRILHFRIHPCRDSGPFPVACACHEPGIEHSLQPILSER